jgi:hypothetical protein
MDFQVPRNWFTRGSNQAYNWPHWEMTLTGLRPQKLKHSRIRMTNLV